MNFGDTVAQILSLFFIMVVGYVMNKKGVIDDTANTRYAKLVVNISLPSQILSTFASNLGVASTKEVIGVLGIALLMHGVYAVVGIIFLFLTRTQAKQKGTYLFMMLFGNVSFMGYPVVQAILGKEAMIYAVLYNVVFGILIYSIGILLISKQEQGINFDIKKLINMPLISSMLSIILYFANIKLPGTIIRSLDFMGNITTPVAMLLIGSVIANMKMRELFDEWRVYLFTIIRLLIVPLVAILLMRVLSIESEMIKGCMILLSAMPVATNTTMLALEYGGDIKLTSKCIFFTTVLCIITIPVITLMF